MQTTVSNSSDLFLKLRCEILDLLDKGRLCDGNARENRIIDISDAKKVLMVLNELHSKLGDANGEYSASGAFGLAEINENHPSGGFAIQTSPYNGQCQADLRTPPVGSDIGVQVISEELRAKLDLMTKYAFTIPNKLLQRLHQSASPTPERYAEACEALRNALSQINRLTKSRRSLKIHIEQLNQRLEGANAELDATVDTLRRHQNNAEVFRQCSTSELSELRSELAKATALIERHGLLVAVSNDKTKFSPRSDQTIRASSASPSLGRLVDSKPTQLPIDGTDTDLPLQLSVALHELDQLRTELTELRRKADRDASYLRGQLAESNADARSLRLQLSRLSGSQVKLTNGETSPPCSQCQRLQSLLNILQAKAPKTSDAGQQLDTHKSGVKLSSDDEKAHIDGLDSSIEAERQAIRAERAELEEKRKEAELLIDLATEERQVNEAVREELMCARRMFASNLGSPTGMDYDEGITERNLFRESQEKFTQTCLLSCDSDKVPDSTNLSLLDDYSEHWESSALCDNSASLPSPELILLTQKQLRDEWAKLHQDKAEFYNTLQKMAHSPDDKQALTENPTQEYQTCSVSRLLSQLKMAQLESESAMDQLKASNAEFITLRERLTHAATEQAYLKSTVEGLDEQVSLLESSLYARTQELHKCQAELAVYRQSAHTSINIGSLLDDKHIKSTTGASRSTCALLPFGISAVKESMRTPKYWYRSFLQKLDHTCWGTICEHRVPACQAITCFNCRDCSVLSLNMCQSRQCMALQKRTRLIPTKVTCLDNFRIVGGIIRLGPLHAMNRLRVPLIRDTLNPIHSSQIKALQQPFLPLKNCRILDVGCGGGILAEPLALLGADVLAIDQVPESIEAARQHSRSVAPQRWLPRSECKEPRYELVDLAQVSSDHASTFNAVVLSEVLEHVTDWEAMLLSAAKCLKPGGYLFVTTINRTLSSLTFGIVGAEYVAGLVPRGTHHWNKFINPNHLRVGCIKVGLEPRCLLGMKYHPLKARWSWTSNLSINYAFSAQKCDDYCTKPA